MRSRLFFALGLSLLLVTVFVPALAQGPQYNLMDGEGKPWLVVYLKEGMECLPFPLEKEVEVPQGLEALYQWMQPASGDADTWLFRMPHGRVLASASRREVGINLQADEMLGLWPNIVTTLAQTTQYVDDDPSCASILDMGGASWLHIQTRAALDGEKMLLVEVRGLANCERGVLVEVWLASPAPATYRYDDRANAQLLEDRELAEEWLTSLSLPRP